ncbi:transmembrane protein, putative [Medicago truncatula]|uniref:Transmembrane protein, putative n=1 Tax=Medicago truncatula TaxID=3880 RepID=G7J7H4_MEDTR|nr:transmembrane protein, putative [Medicago truncatula]
MAFLASTIISSLRKLGEPGGLIILTLVIKPCNQYVDYTPKLVASFDLDHLIHAFSPLGLETSLQLMQQELSNIVIFFFLFDVFFALAL